MLTGAFLIKAKPHTGGAVQPVLAGRLGSRAEHWDWLGTAGGIDGQENTWPAAGVIKATFRAICVAVACPEGQ